MALYGEPTRPTGLSHSLEDSQAMKTMMLEEQIEMSVSEEERRVLEPIMQRESIVSMWRVARLDVSDTCRESAGG